MQILTGSYRKGEKLPSLRELSRRLGVSINTAREAYGNLESRRIIKGVPQSGYYVSTEENESGCCSLDKPKTVQDEFITKYNSMINEFLKTDIHPFCSAMFDLGSLPYSKKLYLSREDQLKIDLFKYPPLAGLYELRVEIARRSIDSGMNISADDIIITEGSMAGIALAIKHFTVPGDTVALESPFYYNFLCLLNVATSALSQHMALNFISGGYYDRHMRQLNKSAEEHVCALRAAVEKHFPPLTKITSPRGGDMQAIYESARKSGALFTPVGLFSLEGRWDNCLRLSAGYYREELEPQIELLGGIIAEQWNFS